MSNDPRSRRSHVVLAAVLILVLAGAGLAPAAFATEVTFRLAPPEGAATVCVAGTFNDWSLDRHVLADAGDGVRKVTVDIVPGTHMYKFVVNGTEWFTDEAAPEFADDGFEGRNSVLVVGDEPFVVDGVITAAGTLTGEAANAAGGADTAVRFRFRPPGEPGVVTVAGTFNDWNPAATPLHDRDGDGVWETTLRVPRGTHMYKFVVNGTEWFTDEFADEFADDGYGGRNSVLAVGATPLTVGEPGGGGAEASGTAVTFRFRPRAGHANSVSVVGTFNEWDAGRDPLQDEDGDGGWEIVLHLVPGEYRYQFVVNGDEWFTDGTAAAFEDDGFGGRHAVLVVGGDPVVVGEGGARRAPAR